MGRTVRFKAVAEVHHQSALEMNLFGAAVEENWICELIFQYSLFLKIHLFREAALEQQQRFWFPKWRCLGVSFPRQWTL